MSEEESDAVWLRGLGLDLGLRLEQQILSAWRNNKDLQPLNPGLLSPLLIKENEKVVQAFIVQGLPELVVRGICAKLQQAAALAAQAAQVAQAAAAQAEAQTGAAAGLGPGSAAGAGAAAGLDLGSATAAGGRTTSAQDGEHPRGGSAGAPGAEHPRDQQEELMATIMELRSALPALTQMARMMPTMAQLLLAKYDYSASKASKSRQGDDFKAQLQAFYGNTMDAQHQLRCMLLDVQLPMTLVTGAHLFKHCWKDDFPVLLGLNNINDTRNGLLLFKPLEHAFDDSRICFTSVQEAGEIQFKLKLLDSGLEEVKVWDYAAEHKLYKGYDASQINGYATTVTFGELQGKSLAFANANRPFKRCLRFQGIRAMRRAEANNWLPKGGSSTQDLFCNSEEAKQLDAWLTLAAQAPPPPDADDDISASD